MVTGYLERADPGTGTATDGGVTRRAELGEFLRTRRERVMPEQVGLPRGGRRRTPGLRREELAQLAGVGVTWYTWLEQGRDIHPSPQVLEAVARVLRLDRDERAHLFAAAGTAPERDQQDYAVDTATVRVLEAVMPFPACVQNGKYDLLAYNRSYERLVGGLDAVPVSDRNSMWLAFTDPVWRAALVDWEDTARRMAAQLRAQLPEHAGDTSWQSFIARLRAASDDFAAMWERHEVTRSGVGHKPIRHDDVGLMNFDIAATWLAPAQGSRLLVFTPADDETTTKLRRMLGR